MGTQAFGTQGQQVDQHTVDRVIPGSAGYIDGELDRGAALVECEVATGLKETAGVDHSARQRDLLKACNQSGAKLVCAACDVDSSGASALVGGVPAHGRRGGRDLDLVTEPNADTAAGLEQRAAVTGGIADDKRDTGTGHTRPEGPGL